MKTSVNSRVSSRPDRWWKPVNTRVSSRPDRWWKLNLLADVAAAMSEYEKSEAQIDEEDERIFVMVPKKKRSLRSSSMATQWTTRVNEKQRSITCAEDNKEEERNLKKRKIGRRFEVGSSSRSMEHKEEERLLIQNPNPIPSTSSSSSSVVTECKKRPPINISKDQEERSHKKRRIVRRLGVEPTQQDTTTIPEWLVNLMMKEETNGYDPKLIVARKLYKSDLDRVQGRLSMPLNQVVSSDFLTEEETRIIYEQSVLKTRKEGISVGLVDPQLKEHVVNLRKWNMNGNWTYVFVDGWNEVVSTNTFKVGNVLPVWSFRSGEGKLCFALPTKKSNGSGHRGSSSGESGLCSR